MATTATARHILVKTENECKDLLQQVQDGADFENIAEKYSQCPSGKNGGSLGEFSPGVMVKEFDQVIFNEELGKIHGPIKTSFGFHLIEILSRK